MRYVTFLDLDNPRVAGRLGNNLFQISAVIGIARANGAEPVLPPWRYAEAFPGVKKYIKQVDWRGHDVLHVRELADYKYQPIEFERINNVCLLRGYFQSYKYWQHCEDEVRDVLYPAEDYQVTDTGVNCAVHVRRGDYLNKPHIHPVQDVDYYQRAMEIMAPNVYSFIGFGDDRHWIIDNLKGLRTMATGNEVEDFAAMMACDYHIIANSSYSWWAAYLARSQHVIAPRKWSGVCDDMSDLIFPDWEVL